MNKENIGYTNNIDASMTDENVGEKDFTEESASNDEAMPKAPPVTFYFTYSQTSKSSATGSGLRISRIVNGPATVSVSTSATETESITGDLSFSNDIKGKN